MRNDASRRLIVSTCFCLLLPGVIAQAAPRVEKPVIYPIEAMSKEERAEFLPARGLISSKPAEHWFDALVIGCGNCGFRDSSIESDQTGLVMYGQCQKVNIGDLATSDHHVVLKDRAVGDRNIIVEKTVAPPLGELL